MNEWGIAVQNENFDLAQTIIDDIVDDMTFKAVMESKMAHITDELQRNQRQAAEERIMKESEDMARRQGIDPASMPVFSATARSHNESAPDIGN